jgi:hypothetical protein
MDQVNVEPMLWQRELEGEDPDDEELKLAFERAGAMRALTMPTPKRVLEVLKRQAGDLKQEVFELLWRLGLLV